MNSIAQNKRYLPHEISTKMQSVKLYRQTKDIGFVCRRYHISKSSLMRWNKAYDGTRESLMPKSHPKVCYTGTDGEKFYQYTMIDEASRERFIFPYKEQSSYSTVDCIYSAPHIK